MTAPDRYCPLCRARQSDASCPVHGIPTIAASVVGSVAELPPGTVLAGRFRVDGLLGKGGMGQVYRATQLSIQRPVALKTLHPRLLQNPDHLGRFYREARAASLLEGPHVVRVYDFGVDEPTSTPFIAMELVRGATLRTRLGGAGIPAGEAAAIAAQVCRALAEAHAAGIVHRDLKSENILVADGLLGPHSVKVMDFGIAKLDREQHGETGSLTASGALMGTPRTMAPEQILGEAVDPRTDLYAVGCVLHELLTGVAPFLGDDPITVINQHLLAPPPPLDPRRGVPPSLIALRDALMAKDRDQRPREAAEVALRLEAVAAFPSRQTSERDVSDVGRWSAPADGVQAEVPGPGRRRAGGAPRPAHPWEEDETLAPGAQDSHPGRWRLVAGAVSAAGLAALLVVVAQPDEVPPDGAAPRHAVDLGAARPPERDPVAASPARVPRRPGAPESPAVARRAAEPGGPDGVAAAAGTSGEGPTAAAAPHPSTITRDVTGPRPASAVEPKGSKSNPRASVRADRGAKDPPPGPAQGAPAAEPPRPPLDGIDSEKW